MFFTTFQFNEMRSSTSFLALTATAGVAVSQKCEHQWSGSFSEEEINNVLKTRQNVEPPPLEIRPLIVNGDSSNRVDLIFFGDGCMWLVGGVEIATTDKTLTHLQTPRTRKTSSSRMPCSRQPILPTARLSLMSSP